MFFNLRKKFLKLRSQTILNKAERRAWYEAGVKELIQRDIDRHRWGVSYSVFDGEELLEASIKSIRSEVDYVNVVYQTKSWYGNPASENLVGVLQKLKEDGLVDELVEYTPDTGMKAGRQERKKRNMGLRAARKAGVDYFMTMDCDEYYTQDDLRKMKRTIVSLQVTHAYCTIVNYGYKPTLRSMALSGLSVQVFSKLRWCSTLKANPRTITLVDPTRQLSHCWNSRHYFIQGIAMHHMSFIRKDIRKKVENSSLGSEFDMGWLSVPSAEDAYAKCPNMFGIDPSLWE